MLRMFFHENCASGLENVLIKIMAHEKITFSRNIFIHPINFINHSIYFIFPHSFHKKHRKQWISRTSLPNASLWCHFSLYRASVGVRIFSWWACFSSLVAMTLSFFFHPSRRWRWEEQKVTKSPFGNLPRVSFEIGRNPLDNPFLPHYKFKSN